VVSLAMARLGVGQFVFHPGDPIRLKEGFRDRLRIAAAIADDGAEIPGGIFRIAPPAPDLAEMKRADAVAFEPPRDAALPLFVQRTSGTTGLPKVLMVTHGIGAYRFGDFGIFSPGSRLLSVTAVEFEGAKQNIYRCLFAGGTVALATEPGFQPAVEAIFRLEVNSLGIAPVHATRLIAEVAGEGLLFPDFRFIRTGTTAVPDALRRGIRERLSPNLYVSYGVTEAGVVTQAGPDLVERESGMVGPPAPGVTVEVTDENGNPVPPRTLGRVRVRSPGLAHGYFEDPEASAEAFRGGWFHTGDLGEFTEDGALIHHGRADDMMIFDGINISPAEIESVLLRHPAVAEAAAISIRDPRRGDIPAAAVVMASPLPAKDLSEFAKSWLGARAPLYLFAMNQLPRNTAGKVAKAELAEIARREHERRSKRPGDVD
jgi:acyl-coenzyme A synthetase/AMP-(fatty) acid ligase